MVATLLVSVPVGASAQDSDAENLAVPEWASTPISSGPAGAEQPERVTASWKPVPGAQSYAIRYFFQGDLVRTKNTGRSTSEVVSQYELVEARWGEWCASVRAQGADMSPLSEWSPQRCIQIEPASAAAAQADTTRPSRPTAGASTAVEEDAIAVSWNASTDNVGVDHYLVRLRGVESRDSELDATERSIKFAALEPGKYWVWLHAVDAAGNYSNGTTYHFQVRTAAENAAAAVGVRDIAAALERYGAEHGSFVGLGGQNDRGYFAYSYARGPKMNDTLIEQGFLDSKYADLEQADYSLYRCGTGDTERAAVFTSQWPGTASVTPADEARWNCSTSAPAQFGHGHYVSTRTIGELTGPAKLATPVVTAALVQDKARFEWAPVPGRAEYHWAVIYPDGEIERGATTNTNHAIAIDGRPRADFCIEVRAVLSGRDSDLSERRCVATPPVWPVPTWDSGIEVNDTSVIANFNVVPGAIRYEARFQLPSGVATVETDTTLSTDTVGISTPIQRQFGEWCTQVRALSAGHIGASDWSAKRCTTVELPDMQRLTLRSPEIAFQPAASPTHVHLYWENHAEAASYEVQWFDDGRQLRTTNHPAGSRSGRTSLDGISGNLCAQVRSTSAPSQISAWTPRTCVTHSPQLATPVISSAVVRGDNVVFTWGAVPDRADYHWAVIEPSGRTVRGTTTATSHSVAHNDRSGEWCFEVIAVLSGRDSEKSERRCAEVADVADTIPPPRVVATSAAVQERTAGLSWGQVTDPSGIEGYVITVNGKVHAEVASSRSSFVFVNLAPATEYTVMVQAKDKAGNLGTGAATSFTTKSLPRLATPEIAFVIDDRGEVAFRWGAVPGSTEYHWRVNGPSGRQINGSSTEVGDSVPHTTTEGNWCVEVRAALAGRDSAFSEPECVEVVAGSVTGLLQNFRALPPGQGFVNTPLDGIQICATPVWADMDTCTTSAQDGSFTLDELPIGQHQVLLFDPRGRYLPKCIADFGRDCSVVPSGLLSIRSSNPDIRWRGEIRMEPVPAQPGNPGGPTPNPEPSDTSPPRWDSDPWATTIVSDLTHSSPRLYFKWENFTDQPITDPSNVNSVPSSGIKEFELTVNGTTRIVSNGDRQTSHDLIEAYLVTLGRPDDRIQTFVEVPGPGTYDVGVRVVDNAGNKSKIATFRLTFSPGSTQGVPGTPGGAEVVVPPPAIPVPPPPPGVPAPGSGPPNLGRGAWGCPSDDFDFENGNTFIAIEWSIEPAGKDTLYRSFIYDEHDDLWDLGVSYLPATSFFNLQKNRKYTVIIQASTLTDDFLGQCRWSLSTRNVPDFVNVEFPATCRATVIPGFNTIDVSWPAATPIAELDGYQVRVFDDDGALISLKSVPSTNTRASIRGPGYHGFESGADFSVEVRAYDVEDETWIRCGDSRVAVRTLTFDTDSAQAWAVCGGVSAANIVGVAGDACVWVNGRGEVAVIKSIQVSVGPQGGGGGTAVLGYADTSDFDAIGGISVCGNVSIAAGGGVDASTCRGHSSGLFGFNGAKVHFVGVSAGAGGGMSVGLSYGSVDVLNGSERTEAIESICQDVDALTVNLPKPPIC